MTGLMRSMESCASHFVVSPIHSPALQIHRGIVLRHIHSDGWMLLLMFQTTEHHSMPFLWFTYINTPEPCDDSIFVIAMCCTEREIHVFQKVPLALTRTYELFVSSFMLYITSLDILFKAHYSGMDVQS